MSTQLGTLEELPQEYRDAMSQIAVAPLWPQMRKVLPHEAPMPVTQAHRWSYSDIRPLLLRAGELTPVEKAERRVLFLVAVALLLLAAAVALWFATTSSEAPAPGVGAPDAPSTSPGAGPNGSPRSMSSPGPPTGWPGSGERAPPPRTRSSGGTCLARGSSVAWRRWRPTWTS